MSDPYEARGMSLADRTQLFKGSGDHRERSMAMPIGPALGPFDGDDLPALVVAAMGADPVRQLDLAALRAEGARRRRELVVGAALAPARLRVASFRQRHGRVSRLESWCQRLA